MERKPNPQVVNTEEFRSWLVSMLKFGPTYVTFIKSDGSERVMHCTLNEDQVIYPEKKTDRSKASNPDVCPVYDLDKKEWRSFRYDSIIEVRFEL